MPRALTVATSAAVAFALAPLAPATAHASAPGPRADRVVGCLGASSVALSYSAPVTARVADLTSPVVPTTLSDTFSPAPIRPIRRVLPTVPVQVATVEVQISYTGALCAEVVPTSDLVRKVSLTMIGKHVRSTHAGRYVAVGRSRTGNVWWVLGRVRLKAGVLAAGRTFDTALSTRATARTPIR